LEGVRFVGAPFFLKEAATDKADALQFKPMEFTTLVNKLNGQAGRAMILLVISCLVYLSNSCTLGSGDTVPASLLPVTLLTQGSLNFDSFEPYFQDRHKTAPPYFFRRTGHGFISAYPLAPGLIAVPVYAIPVLWVTLTRNPDIEDWIKFSRTLEKITAVVIALLAALIFFQTCLALGASDSTAFWLSITFALGTEMWSTGSQGLWMHGPGILFMLLSVLLGIRQVQNPGSKLALLIGITCGIAIAVRLNNLLFAGPFLLWLGWKTPRQWLFAILPAGIITIALFTYNNVCFGMITGAYAMDFGHSILDGLKGLLVSPARGLLIYFPVALFAIPGVLFSLRKPTVHRSLYPVFIVFIGSSLYLVSKWGGWYGGHCYGPRLLSEIQPFLLLLFIPASDFIFTNQNRRWMKPVFFFLMAWSIFIQAVGAYESRYTVWNLFPVSVDAHQERLWDWNDNPVSRSLTEAIQRHRRPKMKSITDWKAAYETTGEMAIIPPKQTGLIEVTVTNLSGEAWSKTVGPFSVYLGYQITGTDGEEIVVGTNRGLLPSAVSPGQSAMIKLPVDAPSKAGDYLLEISLAQDGVDRFSNKGVPPVRMKLQVR